MPWRARTAERVLAGRPATAEWFGRAADAELAAAAPLPDNAFKVTLARNVIVRMLCELAGTARAGAGSVTGRVDGPDKVTGRARYAFEHQVEGAVYAWAVPSVIARGTIRSVDAARPWPCRACSPSSRRTTRRGCPARMTLSWPCSRAGRSPTAGSRGRGGGRDSGGGARGGRAGGDRVRPGAARCDPDRGPPRPVQAGLRQPPLRDRHRGRGLRRRVRRRPGPRRRHLPDPGRAQQPDGAARHRGHLARRHADGVRLHPGPVPYGRAGRRGVRARTRAGPGDRRARRRRLRRQGDAAGQRDPRGHGRPGDRAPGQVRGHPAAAVRA